MGLVTFHRGKQSQYSSELMQDGIYFTSDTHKIMLNGDDYSTDTYTPGVGDTVKTTSAVGALPKGTTAASLKDKTLSQIFDEMLFPTVQPTATPPSAAISLTGYASIQEVGATAPTASNFSTSFNKGGIYLDGVRQSDRAGNMTASLIYRGTPAASSSTTAFSLPVAEGENAYYYSVSYAAGPSDIKDNKGNPATSLTQLPAGNVVSSRVSVFGVYPVFATVTATDISGGTATKLALTTSRIITTTLAAETATSKHKFKVKGTMTKIELKDPFGNWVALSLADFPMTTENIDIQGVSVAYNVYTRNQGTNGSTEFRITYS